ncbi:MAG: cell division protein ZapA [Oscillospiraceae bacterium]|nr:cell division protein ZapA [Oscillospiraceae bacterium]
MNKLKVSICGRIFTLSTDNDVEFVERIAKSLDADIKYLMKEMPSLGLESSAILCALSAYEQKVKSDESIDNIRRQVKEYVDEAGRARDSRDRALQAGNEQRSENEKLRKELEKLRSENKSLKEENEKLRSSPNTQDDSEAEKTGSEAGGNTYCECEDQLVLADSIPSSITIAIDQQEMNRAARRSKARSEKRKNKK